MLTHSGKGSFNCKQCICSSTQVGTFTLTPNVFVNVFCWSGHASEVSSLYGCSKCICLRHRLCLCLFVGHLRSPHQILTSPNLRCKDFMTCAYSVLLHTPSLHRQNCPFPFNQTVGSTLPNHMFMFMNIYLFIDH